MNKKHLSLALLFALGASLISSVNAMDDNTNLDNLTIDQLNELYQSLKLDEEALGQLSEEEKLEIADTKSRIDARLDQLEQEDMTDQDNLVDQYNPENITEDEAAQIAMALSQAEIEDQNDTEDYIEDLIEEEQEFQKALKKSLGTYATEKFYRESIEEAEKLKQERMELNETIKNLAAEDIENLSNDDLLTKMRTLLNIINKQKEITKYFSGKDVKNVIGKNIIELIHAYAQAAVNNKSPYKAQIGEIIYNILTTNRLQGNMNIGQVLTLFPESLSFNPRSEDPRVQNNVRNIFRAQGQRY